MIRKQHGDNHEARWRAYGRIVVALTIWLVVLVAARSSRASVERRVVLLRPSTTDEVTAMALARIKGELIAAGFDVLLLPQREDRSPREIVENAAPELEPLAVFAIFRDKAKAGTFSTAEIWVSDRVVDRTSVERMRLETAEPGRGATVLAVRAVELLKASLSEFWSQPERPRMEPVPAESRSVVPPALAPAGGASVTQGLAAHAALGVLHSFGEIGPVLTPVLSLSHGTTGGLGVRLSAAALGSAAAVTASEGTAHVRQQFAVLDGFVTSRWQGPVQLFASLGAGVYHVEVAGSAVAPYRGKPGQSWSLLTGAGAGAAVEVYSGVAIIVEGQSYWAWPPAVVRIVDTDAGKRHWPVLLARAGLGIAL